MGLRLVEMLRVGIINGGKGSFGTGDWNGWWAWRKEVEVEPSNSGISYRISSS